MQPRRSLAADGAPCLGHRSLLFLEPRGSRPTSATAPGPTISAQLRRRRNLPRSGTGRLRLDGRAILPADIAVLVRRNAEASVMQVGAAAQAGHSRRWCKVRRACCSPSRSPPHARAVRARSTRPPLQSIKLALSSSIFGWSAERLLSLSMATKPCGTKPSGSSIDIARGGCPPGSSAAFRRVLEDEPLPARMLARSSRANAGLTNLLHLGGAHSRRLGAAPSGNRRDDRVARTRMQKTRRS